MGFAPIHVKQGIIEIGAVIAAIDGDTTIDSQMTSDTDYSAIVNNITISGGENDVSPYNTMSGQLVSESRATMVELTFEAGFNDTALINEAFETSAAVVTVSVPTYTRVTGKDMCGESRTKAIMLKFTKASKDFTILLNNAYITSPAQPTFSDDGAATQTMTMKCLITDYVLETKD